MNSKYISTNLQRQLPEYVLSFLEHAEKHGLEIQNDDARDYFSGVKDQETLRAAIIEYFGPRCGDDASSYLYAPEQGICSCCEAWLVFDRFTRSVVYPAAIIEGL
jgi:hypothetical protein